MNRKLFLPLALLALAALGGGVFYSLGGDPRGDGRALSRGFSAEDEALDAPAVVTEDDSPRALTSGEIDQAAELSTTVVFPLQIEFELLSTRGRLSSPGVPDMGYDATARLRGSVHDSNGKGVVGQAEFVAGANTGRVLVLGPKGRFGANDLYPGLGLVRITGRGVPGALREVRLREKRSTRLNIGFGRSAVVFGQVFDRRNNFVAGVRVEMDGQIQETDEEGVFRFVRMTSGKLPVFLSKPGYADLRQEARITAGTTIEKGRLSYTLEEEARLRIVLPDRVGTGAPARVKITRPLEARFAGRERKYPWHQKSDITLYAGETREIFGLPSGRVRVEVFQPGAMVEPAARETTLIAGKARTLTFSMSATPILAGRVLFDGNPAVGAVVQLEAPDITGASIVARGGALGRAQAEVNLAGPASSARQTVVTGADGRFVFSACESIAPLRYLTARSADGRAWAGRPVEAGVREADLELAVAKTEGVSLTLETSSRFQALPVEYAVNGKPYAALLAPDERLEIEGLTRGIWRYTARWAGDRIGQPTTIVLEEDQDLFIPLPAGAIQGQSADLRRSLRGSQARR
ncbi:MAG: hypothetical protein ABGY71_11060 [bacterium]|nr:hypothetical protein [Planctomycetota bacterium]HIL53302.1 hypothetical protein [Planctomycetota bacterium]